jgi:hypothetical protein
MDIQTRLEHHLLTHPCSWSRKGTGVDDRPFVVGLGQLLPDVRIFRIRWKDTSANALLPSARDASTVMEGLFWKNTCWTRQGCMTEKDILLQASEGITRGGKPKVVPADLDLGVQDLVHSAYFMREVSAVMKMHEGRPGYDGWVRWCQELQVAVTALLVSDSLGDVLPESALPPGPAPARFRL